MPAKRPRGVTRYVRNVEMVVEGFLVEDGVDARAFDGKGQVYEGDQLGEWAGDTVQFVNWIIHAYLEVVPVCGVSSQVRDHP
jgi:hypothetical protein